MLRVIIAALAIACSATTALSAPPSKDSIREILRVTDARKLVEGMIPQMEAMIKGSTQQALGRALNENEQRIVDSLTSKLLRMMKDELNWETLEPLYLRIYAESFTQEEVDGMLAFYKSPAGEALIKKMPLVVQQSMTAMQERMGPMMQKIQAAIEDTVEEINVASRKLK